MGVCMRRYDAGVTLVEHELGRRLLPDFRLLCHLSNFTVSSRWFLLILLDITAIIIDSTNESWDACLVKLSLFIFAAFAATRELKLQVAIARVSRNCYVLSIAV